MKTTIEKNLNHLNLKQANPIHPIHPTGNNLEMFHSPISHSSQSNLAPCEQLITLKPNNCLSRHWQQQLP